MAVSRVLGDCESLVIGHAGAIWHCTYLRRLDGPKGLSQRGVLECRQSISMYHTQTCPKDLTLREASFITQKVTASNHLL